MDRTTQYLHPGYRYSVKVIDDVVIVNRWKRGDVDAGVGTIIYNDVIVDFTDFFGNDIITVDPSYGLGDELFGLAQDDRKKFQPIPLDPSFKME